MADHVKVKLQTGLDFPSVNTCHLEVDRDWLAERPANSEGVREITMGVAELVEWRGHPGGIALPIIGEQSVSGNHLHISIAALENHPDRYKLSVSVMTNLNNMRVGEILSGAIQLRARDGFDRHLISNFHLLPARRLIRRLWNENDILISAITLGAGVVELELLNASTDERRLVVVTHATERTQLWRLSDCGADEHFLKPNDILRRIQQRTDQSLAATNQRLRTSSTGGVGRAAGEVVYQLNLPEDDESPVSTPEALIRPDFGLEFSAGPQRGVWFPAGVVDSGAKIAFSGQDVIAEAKAAIEQDQPDTQPDPQLTLTWQVASDGDGRVWSLSRVEHHEVVAVGFVEQPLQGDFAWTFGSIDEPPAAQKPIGVFILMYSTRPVCSLRWKKPPFKSACITRSSRSLRLSCRVSLAGSPIPRRLPTPSESTAASFAAPRERSRPTWPKTESFSHQRPTNPHRQRLSTRRPCD